MSITPGSDVPLLGENGRPVNNPLVILNQHLLAINGALAQIAANTGSPASAMHRYGVAEAEDKGGHGKVWGSYCIACSEQVSQYVYPCRLAPAELVKPPMFFTIGDVFEVDDEGRMVKYVPPKT